MRLTLTLLRRTDYWDRFVHRLVRQRIGQGKYRALRGWKEWNKDWYFTKYGPTHPLELKLNSLNFGHKGRPENLVLPYYEPYIFEKDQVGNLHPPQNTNQKPRKMQKSTLTV